MIRQSLEAVLLAWVLFHSGRDSTCNSDPSSVANNTKNSDLGKIFVCRCTRTGRELSSFMNVLSCVSFLSMSWGSYGMPLMARIGTNLEL